MYLVFCRHFISLFNALALEKQKEASTCIDFLGCLFRQCLNRFDARYAWRYKIIKVVC